jgi:hypothetical protein
VPNVVNKDGLLAILGGLTGLSAVAIEWGLNPNAFVGDQDRAKVQLQLFGIEALGVDEHRRAYGPPGYPATAYVTTEIGNREVTINVYAETYDYNVEAQEILDLIRTAIRSEAVNNALFNIQLVFQWMSGTTVLKEHRNNRAISAASADIKFGGIAQFVSSVEDNQGWIETVNTTNVVPGTFTP